MRWSVPPILIFMSMNLPYARGYRYRTFEQQLTQIKIKIEKNKNKWIFPYKFKQRGQRPALGLSQRQFLRNKNKCFFEFSENILPTAG